MHRTTHIRDLAKYSEHANSDHRAENDFLMLRVAADTMADKLPANFRVDSVSIYLCTRGTATIHVNFEPVDMRPGTILVLNPNNLIEIRQQIPADIECYAIFLSREFLNLMSLDSRAINYSKMSYTSPNIMQLSPADLKLMQAYFNVIELSRRQNPEATVYSVSIARALISALIYQLMDLASHRSSDEPDRQQRNSRKNYYVKDFMLLVAKHFREQRAVNFYADKLFISPKYLSLIIKDATGFTATEWIDHYVIMEAKKQLRFSGRNIQQIAYDMNFHNQSSFGKYFKLQTGMSPSSFRKS